MKRKINLWDYAGRILEATGKGVLLNSQADGNVNTMTIGWGTLGIQWGKPIFIAFVRESRYTKELLDKNPEFTVSIPVDGVDKNILKVCGTVSGRDTDKIRDLGLHLEDGETVNVPAVRELPLTLECKVIYRQTQDLSALVPEEVERYYSGKDTGNVHTAYYGLVTDAYILE